MNSHEDEPRRRGRPREVADCVRVNLSLPASDYDRLYRQARANDKSIPALIREAISVTKNTATP
jgi:hypothetical protein